MMAKILRCRPSFHPLVWGGTRLHAFFPEAQGITPLGEAWVISAHPAGSSTIEGGPFDGLPLSEVYRNHRELFGPGNNLHFPLLIKLIDAAQDLSIQVHPDDAYAYEHEASPGKQEAWVILSARSNSTLVLGHTAVDRQSFLHRIETKDPTLFKHRSVQSGDCFEIEPGTVHAIGAGIFLYEVQQNSTITYRIYDYDRVDAQGHKRQLHLDKSLDMIRFPDTKILDPIPPQPNGELIRNAFFTLSRLEISGSKRLEPDGVFRAVTCIRGSGTLGGQPIREGESLIVLPEDRGVRVEGHLTILVARPMEAGML